MSKLAKKTKTINQKTKRKLKTKLKPPPYSVDEVRSYIASLNMATSQLSGLLRSVAGVLDEIRAHHLPIR